MFQLLIDANGVAKALDCSRRHVERMNAAGKMPQPVRLGRAVRWSVAVIESWIKAGCPGREQWEACRGRKGVSNG